ncbi:MAG: nitroreductase family protein [Spirochaetota bacterium]
MNYIPLLTERTSVRSFTPEGLTDEHRREAVRLLAEWDDLPAIFDVPLELTLLPSRMVSGEKLGTYGVIRNLSQVITGVSPNTDAAILQFGYQVQRVLIRLRSLGIESCWLGGTFSRGVLNRVLGLESGQVIPAVIPIGYPAKHRSSVDGVMRLFARSNRRKTLDELCIDTDTNISADEALATALETVRLAPSASNKQPWRFSVTEDRSAVRLYLQESSGYNRSLGYPIQMLDMGIAMCHLELALSSLGETPHWQQDSSGQLHDTSLQYIATCTRQ